MPSWMGIFKIFECNMQNKNDFTLPYLTLSHSVHPMNNKNIIL